VTRPAETVVLAYWAEHREQLRQSENQRATMTNYVLVITAAVTGFVVQLRFGSRTLPLSAFVVLLGAYGALTAAKYDERAEYHLHQARALTRVLRDMPALPEAEAALDRTREEHYRRHPRLHPIRLHHLWTGLNFLPLPAREAASWPRPTAGPAGAASIKSQSPTRPNLPSQLPLTDPLAITVEASAA
jgi:hypothetical protein